MFLRRSGLRVRPLLRPAFHPQHQQQNQARSHGSRQQAQQQQAVGPLHDTGKQQPFQDMESQGQEDGLHTTELDSGQLSQQAPANFKQQAQFGAQDPQTDRASVGGDTQPVDPAAQAQQGAGHQPNSSETSAKSRTSKKGKRTKKDYAAWAGATAETRATARAYLEGNPDIALDSQSMHAGGLLLTNSLILYRKFAVAKEFWRSYACEMKSYTL